jgi:exopolysaccharide biosynthesis polyprenyl glycosylphosphotransferase
VPTPAPEGNGAVPAPAAHAPPKRRRASIHTLVHELQQRGGLTQPQSSQAVARRDALFRRSLAVADVIAATVAVGAAAALGHRGVSALLLVALPLVVLVCKILGLYDVDEDRIRKSTLDDGTALFQAATMFALLIWLADGAVVKGGLDRVQVLELWPMLWVLMLVGRAITRRLVTALARPERLLVVGHQAAADRLERKLGASHHIKAEVVGCIPLVSDGDGSSATHVEGGVRRLAEEIADREVHRVVVAPIGSDPHMLDTIRVVKSLGVKVSIFPRLFEVVGSSVRFDDVDGLTLLGVPRYGLTKSSMLLKWGVDLVCAAVGLVLLAPVFAFLAIAIKLDSPGPVFFRQRRIGRSGREFTMLKFRTMVRGADRMKADLRHLNEADGLFKIARDPRITRIGRVLRRLSLDELPQLWNVLRGEMSLVGPRPLVPDEDSRVEGWHRRRLMVTPGMTGVWQILGSSRVPLNEMVKLDYLYTANWSLWLDAKILLRTALYIGQRRGL